MNSTKLKTLIPSALFTLCVASYADETDSSTYTSVTESTNAPVVIDATKLTQNKSSTTFLLNASNININSNNYDATTGTLIDGTQDAITITTGSDTDTGTLKTSYGNNVNVYGDIVYNINGGNISMTNASTSINEAIVATGYSGANESVFWGSTYIYITDGNIGGSVFGAGDGTLVGDSNIVISGGNIYGKGSKSIVDSTGGDDDGHINRGARGIFGGGSWGGTVEGDTNITITAGNVETEVNGAGYTLASVIEGDTNITISGGTIYGDVTGGSLDEGEAVGRVYGDTYVTISGGSISERTATTGDGYLLDDEDGLIANTGSVYGFTGVSDGSVYVKIDGGTIEGNVYGVAKALATSNNDTGYTYSYVKENVSIDIDSTVTSIGGDIFGVTEGADVGGNVTIDIDLADKNTTVIDGNIYGIYATEDTSTVTGNLTLNVDNYTGKLYAIYAKNYENAYVGGDLTLNITNTTFTGYDNASKWTALVLGADATIEGNYTANLTNIYAPTELYMMYSWGSDKDLSEFYIGGNLNVTIDGDSTIEERLIIGFVYSADDNCDFSKSTIGGDINLTLGGNLYVGGKADDTVTFADGSTISYSDEAVMISGAKYASVAGNVNVDITGGTYEGNITAGINSGTIGSFNDDGTIDTSTGNIDIEITGGTFEEIYASSHNKGSSTTNVHLTDTQITYLESIYTDIDFDIIGGLVLGDVTLDISGGTFTDDIWVGASSQNLTIGSTSEKTLYENIVLGSATATISGDAVFTSTATINGGSAEGGSYLIFDSYDNSSSATALSVIDFDKTNITDSNVKLAETVSGVKLEISGSSSTVTNGALVSIANSTVSFSDSEFSYNNVSSDTSNGNILGGIIQVDADSTASFVDSDFINNTVTTDSGYSRIHGGIIETQGYTTITTSNFTENNIATIGNSASHLYGGILAVRDNETIVSYSVFSNNTIEANNSEGGQSLAGGIIYAGSGDGDVSATDGDATVTISYTEFSNNSATARLVQGGVVAVESGATVEISNSTFTNNSASSDRYAARGGAVNNYKSNLTISNTLFDNNSAIATADAKSEGGALHAKYDSSTTLNNVTFTNNYASYTGDAGKLARGGAIFLSDGADVTYNVTTDITNVGNYVSINGEKTDKYGGFLYFGDTDGVSEATFNVSSGATLTIGDGREGYDSIASEDNSAVITKEGSGTMTVNSSMADFSGTLNVTAGTMNVNNVLGASVIDIDLGATLALTINGSETLSSTSLSYTNDGTLKLIAGVGLDSSQSYSIAATSDINFGSVVTYGGSYDGDGNFVMGSVDSVTVDDSTSVATFTTTNITTNSNIEIKKEDSSDIVDVMLSFNLAEDSTTTVATSAEDVTSSTVIGELTTLSAWDFDITLESGDTVVLTYYIGEVDSSLILLYHINDDGASDETSNIISYDGEYIVFEANDFSTWAVVAVPEPSTYAMIFGALALGLAVYRRRK